MQKRTLKALLAPTITVAALFALAACDDTSEEQGLSLEERQGRLSVISPEGREMLAYQFETYPAPEGVDPAFARSAFIHPLNAPRGQRLTQIQPEDHYHHYGIWNPWTHTSFRGKEVDFWNLAKKQGTVRFAGFVNKDETDNTATIQAKHEHVVFGDDGEETVAINELQTIRVDPQADDPDSYIVDIVSELECGTDDPITLLEYRYGGFGWRTTEVWNAENSSVLTSEGADRNASDGSLARWCIVQGEVEGGHAGIVVMSHPENYNHPEPLRIWPESSHEGQIFFNYSPTKNTDWVLEPGKTHTLRYRLLVFNGQKDAAAANAAWDQFANPQSK